MTTRTIVAILLGFGLILYWLWQLKLYSAVVYLAIFTIGPAASLMYGTLQHWIHVAKYGQELSDPFFAEVLFDGVPVAIVSEREVTEMFWRTYRIRPIFNEFESLINDDKLWEQCRFTFRDPVTNMTCENGFVGGKAPFIRFGEISLRGLYFKPSRSSIKSPIA